MGPLVHAFVDLLVAVEQVLIDRDAADTLDRVVEDVFAQLQSLSRTEAAELRIELMRLRAATSAQYQVDTIDLILHNIPEG